jgi:hypothetical protein
VERRHQRKKGINIGVARGHSCTGDDPLSSNVHGDADIPWRGREAKHECGWTVSPSLNAMATMHVVPMSLGGTLLDEG